MFDHVEQIYPDAWIEMAALRKERDDLAESLAQIEVYQPGILNVAKAWMASIEQTARVADDMDEWPDHPWAVHG